jgi:hypothetical protein
MYRRANLSFGLTKLDRPGLRTKLQDSLVSATASLEAVPLSKASSHPHVLFNPDAGFPTDLRTRCARTNLERL